MNREDFDKLDINIKHSLIFAMYIRNEMESFHSEHLSDEQMKELNPIIRQAIYNMLRFVEIASKKNNSAMKRAAIKEIEFQIMLIPDYWEMPSEELFQKEINQISDFKK